MQPTLEEEQRRQQQGGSTGYCHDCNFWICVIVEDEDQSCQCPDCNCECPDCSGLHCDCGGLHYYVTQRIIFLYFSNQRILKIICILKHQIKSSKSLKNLCILETMLCQQKTKVFYMQL